MYSPASLAPIGGRAGSTKACWSLLPPGAVPVPAAVSRSQLAHCCSSVAAAYRALGASGAEAADCGTAAGLDALRPSVGRPCPMESSWAVISGSGEQAFGRSIGISGGLRLRPLSDSSSCAPLVPVPWHDSSSGSFISSGHVQFNELFLGEFSEKTRKATGSGTLGPEILHLFIELDSC